MTIRPCDERSTPSSPATDENKGPTDQPLPLFALIENAAASLEMVGEVALRATVEVRQRAAVAVRELGGAYLALADSLAPAPDCDRRRVLLVDDDRHLLACYVRVLRSLPDVEVATATTAEETAILIDHLRPDVLISDVDLGGGRNGFAVAQAAVGVVPVVALASGTVDASRRDRAREIGAATLLEKPFEVRPAVLALLARVPR